MIKYGVPPAEWIRKLGKRMLEFDFKAYSKSGKGFSVPIGEGDEDWPEVLKALAEVGYGGWATAEVGRGDAKHHAQCIAHGEDREREHEHEPATGDLQPPVLQPLRIATPA